MLHRRSNSVEQQQHVHSGIAWLMSLDNISYLAFVLLLVGTKQPVNVLRTQTTL